MSEIQVGQINSTDGSTAITVSTGNTTLSGSLAMGANNISFSNGNGIDFSASEGSGATSSVLDDYEEGTWTPEFGASTSYSGQNYNIRTGKYTKTGNMVFATFDIELQTAGSFSGTALLINLPFTPTGNYQNGWVTYYENVNSNLLEAGMLGPRIGTTANFTGKGSASASTPSIAATSLFKNNTRIMGHMVYNVS